MDRVARRITLRAPTDPDVRVGKLGGFPPAEARKLGVTDAETRQGRE